jgi:predicted nucleic acid-binding protein
MSVLVADASPLIFLAKLDLLGLLGAVFPGPVLVPESVRDELSAPQVPPVELRRLRQFLGLSQVVRVDTAESVSAALSQADRDVLALASRERPAVVLTDDSLVRRVALAEGLRVAGTLGVLIRARTMVILSSAEAQQALDELVGRHGFRISVALYQESRRLIG